MAARYRVIVDIFSAKRTNHKIALCLLPTRVSSEHLTTIRLQLASCFCFHKGSFEAKRCEAHRDDGKRFIVRSDQKLTVFLELERITHALAVSALLGDDSN
jgi:hypothetical protein